MGRTAKGKSAAPAPRRKGAARMADIPAATLAALNAGTEETVTLVEWLAIDIRRLARAVAPEALGSTDAAQALIDEADRLAASSVTVRSKGMGAAVRGALARLPAAARRRAFERLAGHPSDMVRGWTTYSIGADRSLSLDDRLDAGRRFAADRHMAVRECAWDAWRPYLAADLERGLALLSSWVEDDDPSVRRCAIEGTRPRGVWTAHLDALKADPTPAASLLEACRSDASEYVRKAVANWLNDASKSTPAWVKATCGRWSRESPTKETAWIVTRGLRTLRKG